MNTIATITEVSPALLQPITLTDEEMASALEVAAHVTPDLINELKARPVSLQSPQVVAQSTFAQPIKLLKALQVYDIAPIDCSTTAGDESARAIRLKLKTLRTRVTKLALEANRPYAEQEDAHRDLAGLIVDAVTPIEDRYDAAIKAQEKVVADRRAAAQAAADERARQIVQRIADVHAMADIPADMPSGEIRARIQDVTITELAAEDFDHRHGEAIAAKDRAIAKLEAAAARAEEHEARERQIIADRRAFEKELADARAEAARMASEKRAEQEARDLREAEEAVLRLVEQKKREQEDLARARISDLRRLTVWALSATPGAIRAKQAELQELNQGQFHPLEREAMEAYDEVTAALPVLLTLAEDKERTAAERLKREQRATQIENRIFNLRGISRQFDTRSESLEAIRNAREAVAGVLLTEENFGDRVEEARRIVCDECAALDEIKVRREQADKDAAEADCQRKEDARIEAVSTRRDAVLRINAEGLYSLLIAVKDDADYLHLDEDLRALIDAKLADIAAAL